MFLLVVCHGQYKKDFVVNKLFEDIERKFGIRYGDRKY
jgi:hypothetical protein